jgi:hypothetical protein
MPGAERPMPGTIAKMPHMIWRLYASTNRRRAVGKIYPESVRFPGSLSCLQTTMPAGWGTAGEMGGDCKKEEMRGRSMSFC